VGIHASWLVDLLPPPATGSPSYSLLGDGDLPELGQKVLPGLARPSRVQLRQADQKSAQVADETCGLLRRCDAQVVQEDIYGFAVGSTDGAGERECIVDVRCHALV